MTATPREGFKARLRALSRRQQIAFMAALCERLLPNYGLYAQMTGQGDPGTLRVVLDLAWESLMVREAKIDFARQADKLSEAEPPEDDESFGARRAVEVMMALSTLLDALQGEAPDAPLTISGLSKSGVQAVVEMTEEAEDDDVERAAARLREHPLMADERGFQEAVLEAAEARLDREALKALRRLGRNDGVSNLGLSLE